jgi:hypothetical protein
MEIGENAEKNGGQLGNTLWRSLEMGGDWGRGSEFKLEWATESDQN